MPSTYTDNGGIELPDNGEQASTWGNTVNDNMNIIDRLTNGVGSISLSGTTHTLTTTDGATSDGHYKVLVLGGSPSGTNTITVSPNNGQHVYIVKNNSGQTATFTQGSGANVSVATGATKIIYCDGAGSGAAVVDITGSLDLGTLVIGGTTVTATGAELNILDGVTSTTAELNILDGVTATTAELNIMGGVTATSAELNILDGVTASTPEINKLDGLTATTAQLNTLATGGGVIPSGGIIMWSGAVSAIPTGWVLCNGSNSTPDLRNRFVVGAGSTYAVNATGGADSVTLSTANMPAHNHSFSASGTTSTIGNHTHPDVAKPHPTDNGRDGDSGSNSVGLLEGQTLGNSTGAAGSHNHTFSVSGTTGNTGDGTAHENRPPYYALAYIMKT